jgi:pimeloyl-[acyl-carrier protein] methyl ester esterase
VSARGGWVLVPGWGADEVAFAAVQARLPRVATRVVGWDAVLARGGAAVEEACLALGPGPVRLAGWSLGALLALEAAIAAPGRHAGLALIAGTARFCGDGEEHPGVTPRALRALAARLGREPAAAVRGFAAWCAAPDGGDAAGGWWSAQAGRFAPQALARGLDALAALDLRGGLAALRAPVRLLHGERDGVVPVAAAAALAARCADGRLTVLPGRGHALPFTAPDEIAALLAGFEA